MVKIMNRTEQNRTEQNRTEQNRTEQNRTEQNCVICGHESFFLKSVNSFNVSKCGACGLEFILPMPTEECLREFYSEYADIRALHEVTKRNAYRNLDFLKKEHSINQTSNILDYGCGNNMFIDVCRQNSFSNSFGYDPYINRVNDEKRINCNHANENKWDVISLWGVLEHLTSPIEHLFTLKKLLSEDGLIVLTTIYIEGKIPFQYKPPEHTLYFTKQSLKELANYCELKIINFDEYKMEQNSNVYLSILLRTMPDEYKKLIAHNMPDYVEVPTNEIRLVLKAKS